MEVLDKLPAFTITGGTLMIKSSDLSWIVVSDLKKAKQFFTTSVGLKELKYVEELGWAELGGEDGGSVVGLAEANPTMDLEAGKNAIITLTVDDCDKMAEELKKRGVSLVGEVMEVPGHVKLQMFKDSDGNLLQIVENLD